MINKYELAIRISIARGKHDDAYKLVRKLCRYMFGMHGMALLQELK